MYLHVYGCTPLDHITYIVFTFIICDSVDFRWVLFVNEFGPLVPMIQLHFTVIVNYDEDVGGLHLQIQL